MEPNDDNNMIYVDRREFEQLKATCIETNALVKALAKKKNATQVRELMFGNKNLLDVAHNPDVPAHFINDVMDILFTQEEIRKGIIPSCKNHGKKSSRKILDETKVELLKQAVFYKFKIEEDCKAEQWEATRIIANRHGRDVAKKFGSSSHSDDDSEIKY
jgi:hypothetical protein